MSYCRVVEPELVVLPISLGQQLTVNRRLTFGQTRRIQAQAEGLERAVAYALAYLVAWTVTDRAGQVVPLGESAPEKLAALDALDDPSGNEILAAIGAHHRREGEALAEEKKLLSGALASSAPFASAA